MKANAVNLMFYSLLMLFLVACTKDESLPETSGGDPVASSINKTKALQILNDVRRSGCKCGDAWYGPVPALTWNATLEKVALQHSVEMKRTGNLSHVSNGKGPGERIREAGYQWIIYGENVAVGYSDEKSVIDGWLKSPGHCKNIMNPAFREVGMARSGNYWTQDFGSR